MKVGILWSWAQGLLSILVIFTVVFMQHHYIIWCRKNTSINFTTKLSGTSITLFDAVVQEYNKKTDNFLRACM